MEKIFLSHSSKDKEYVRPIFDYFGADRCVYDEMTFEAGMPTINEIFKGLDSSDIFVFFISDSSLGSEWVQEEIKVAEANLHNDVKKLSQIFPVIIDDKISYSDLRIPDFLKKGFGSYNLRHIYNHKIACKKIEDQLTKLQIEKNINFDKKINFFMVVIWRRKNLKRVLMKEMKMGKLSILNAL